MNSPQNSSRRVVITGLGVLSPIGIGGEALWENLAALTVRLILPLSQ